jgi:hypothetical protein
MIFEVRTQIEIDSLKEKSSITLDLMPSPISSSFEEGGGITKVPQTNNQIFQIL